MNAIGNNSILTLSRLWKGVMGVLGIVLLASCSETASVPEGDQLYTGQRKIKYENYKASDHFSTTQEDDREPILPPTDLDKLEIPAHSIAALVAADTDAYRRKVDTKAIHHRLLLQSCLFSTLASPMLCFSQSIHSGCLLNG